MEKFIFRRPEVLRELEKTVEARLHTDGHGSHRPISLRNQKLQMELTGTPATPVYVIQDPATKKVLGVFRGATQDAGEFAKWLAGAIGRMGN
jgi:hypothetical protein